MYCNRLQGVFLRARIFGDTTKNKRMGQTLLRAGTSLEKSEPLQIPKCAVTSQNLYDRLIYFIFFFEFYNTQSMMELTERVNE